MKQNLTYYKKYHLKNDISIRYHYVFETNPNLEKKWILKDHKTGEKSVISELMAKRMIEDMYKKEYPLEIIGKINPITKKYEKIFLQNNGKCKILTDDDLIKKQEKKYWKLIDNFYYRKVYHFEYKIFKINNEKYKITILKDNQIFKSYISNYNILVKNIQQCLSSVKLKAYVPTQKNLNKKLKGIDNDNTRT